MSYQGLGFLFPKSFKFLSAGTSLGMFIGFMLSYFLSDKWTLIFAVIYFIWTCVSFYGIWDDFKQILGN